MKLLSVFIIAFGLLTTNATLAQTTSSADKPVKEVKKAPKKEKKNTTQSKTTSQPKK